MSDRTGPGPAPQPLAPPRRLRTRDADDRSWVLASCLQAHHLAALDPPSADVMLDEIEGRTGALPLIGFLRAEVALGAGRHADAAAHQPAAWRSSASPTSRGRSPTCRST